MRSQSFALSSPTPLSPPASSPRFSESQQRPSGLVVPSPFHPTNLLFAGPPPTTPSCPIWARAAYVPATYFVSRRSFSLRGWLLQRAVHHVGAAAAAAARWPRARARSPRPSPPRRVARGAYRQPSPPARLPLRPPRWRGGGVALVRGTGSRGTSAAVARRDQRPVFGGPRKALPSRWRAAAGVWYKGRAATDSGGLMALNYT